MNGKQTKHNVKNEKELEWLAKVEEQNRLLLADAKSIPSLQTRRRGGSISSSISNESSTDGSKGDSSNGSKSSSVITLPWPPTSNLSNSSNSLTDRWAHLVNNWDQYAKKRSFITDLIRKGIPDQLRPLVWRLYSGAYDSPVRKLYPGYLAIESPVERAIRRDISRTFPKHDLFKDENGYGQESLFRVIKAYSIHDREVGYCQGSGFIVGLLLMQLPEIDAFAVLVQLMSEFRLREMYKPSMIELGVCMFQLEHLLADHLPDLYTHFVTHSFAPSLYASAWFLTLFSTILSVGMATRVIDLYMVDGNYYIFRMALALLKFSSEKLLNCDMESMVVYLQHEGPIKWERNAPTIFQLAASFKLNTKRLKKLEKEYLQLRSQEREDQIELRRLRTENGLLHQRVARLEEECVGMADRLVQSNLDRAEEAENLLKLRCQISIMKRKYAELQTATKGANSSPQVQAVHSLSKTSHPPPIEVEIETVSSFVNSSSSPSSTAPSQSRDIPSAAAAVQLVGDDESGHNLPTSPPTSQMSGLPSTGGDLFILDSSDQLAMITVHRLQSDLTLSRAREADLNLELIELKARHHELEELKADQLTRSTEQIGILKDEIFALRSRDNDATTHVEKLRKQLNDIDAMWQAHLSRCSRESKSTLLRLASTSSQSSLEESAKRLSDAIIEAAYADQKMTLRQQITEVSSQRDLAEHRADRLDHRVTELLESRATADARQRKLQLELKQSIHACAEIESMRKMDALMWRTREMELTTQLTELRQSSLQFECKYESLLVSHNLHTAVSACGDSVTTATSEEGDSDDDRTTIPITTLNEIPYPTSATLTTAISSLTPIDSTRCFDLLTPKPSQQSSLTEQDFPHSNGGSIRHHVWKNVPSTLMTESIGPLDELYFLPEDSLISSVYLSNHRDDETQA